VRLRFLSSQGVMPLDAGTFTVDPRGSLLDEVRGLLGEAAARLEQDPDLAPV
jgi:hypothetical protein